MRGRANAVWLVVLAVEFVHGTLPWIFLRPRVGDFRSGQIGVLTGSALFLVIVFLRAVDDAAKLRGWLARGTAVGRPDARLRVESGVTSRGVRPESIAAECNLSHGELMAVGLAIFCDDAVDCVATTPGIRESPKEDWLAGRAAPGVSSVGMGGR